MLLFPLRVDSVILTFIIFVTWLACLLFCFRPDADLRHDAAYPSFYEQEQSEPVVDQNAASASTSRLPAPLPQSSGDRHAPHPESLVESPAIAPPVPRAAGDIGHQGTMTGPGQGSTPQAAVDQSDGLWTHLDRLSLRQDEQEHQGVPMPGDATGGGPQSGAAISLGTTNMQSHNVQQFAPASAMMPPQTQPLEQHAHHPHQLLLQQSDQFQQRSSQPSLMAPIPTSNIQSIAVGHHRYPPPLPNTSNQMPQQSQQLRSAPDARAPAHLQHQHHYPVPYSMPPTDLQAQAHAFAAAAAAVAAQQHHHHQQQQHAAAGGNRELRLPSGQGQYDSRPSAYTLPGTVGADGTSLHPGSMLGLAYAGGGVVPPPPNDYLSAQAMAAAAAAAAAVYKGGGLPGLQLANSVHNAVGGATHNPSYLNSSSVPMQPRSNSGGGGGRSGRGSSGYGKSNGHGGDRAQNSGSSVHAVRELLASGGNSTSGSSKEVLTASDLIGRAEELARDQQGCRACQRAIEDGDPECINIIFEECFDKFVELTTHAFANYLTQKIFQYCSDEQRLALVRQCAPAMATISTNMHGTRAVQRMVECLSTPEQVRAVCDALLPAAVSLMCDINGNHVIQKVLHRMEPADNQFVYDAVANNCYELATQRHACCVMQRCMDFATPQQRDQLAVQIIANALPLVSNCYSNYVVQYLLDLNIPAYTEAIVSRLRGNVASLSMQKFASNVIEKSLQNSSQQCRQHLIAELVDPNVMSRLLLDSYANYVIQRALMVAEGDQLEQLCEAIRPHLGALKSSAYGKRIQAKLLKRMPKACLPLPAMSPSPNMGAIGTLGGIPTTPSQLGPPHNGTPL